MSASSTLTVRSLRIATMLALVALVTMSASVGAPNTSHLPVNGRIAFAMRSDLFSIGPNGRHLKRITSGADVDEEPAWSPDGRWLAFSRTDARTKRTSVYVVAGSGGPPRLLVQGAHSPSWAPTGRRLAVFRLNGNCFRFCPTARGVWTVPFGGGKPRLLAAGAWSSDWSSSGRELAVMDSDGIAIVTVASAAIRRVRDLQVQPGTELDWSPDGSRFLLVTDEGILTVSVADGSTKTVVASPPTGDPDNCPSSVGPATWSPNGRWIAYEESHCVTNEGVAPFPVGSITVLDDKGVWQRELDNSYWGRSLDYGPYNVIWSPDSRYLAFIEDAVASTGKEFLEVASMSPKGGYRRLKAGVHGLPSWQRLPP